MSQKLYFQDLEIGDLYTGFPVDGDDAGHGGYLGGHYLFKKTSPTLGIRQWDGAESTFNADGQSPVIKIISNEGLTPELREQVLALRQKMNDRKEFVNGRILILPPGTGFTGDSLYGFRVQVANKPIALGSLDFPQGKTFSVLRTAP